MEAEIGDRVFVLTERQETSAAFQLSGPSIFCFRHRVFHQGSSGGGVGEQVDKGFGKGAVERNFGRDFGGVSTGDIELFTPPV